MIHVAVLGYGTVGSGVVEVIENNNAEVSVKAGEEMHVKYILDLRDFPGDPYEDRVVHDFQIILEDAEVSVICEVMGGVGAAYQFTRQALEAGKSVCTSNKELVARHGAELLEIAKNKNCSYMFEASVGGGDSHHPAHQQGADGGKAGEYIRHFERYYQLHSDEDGEGGSGLRGDTEKGAGAGLCGAEPGGGCGGL